MRLVVQRVLEANVKIDDIITGSIQKGLVVLLGIHKSDTSDLIPWFINKLINLRVFSDENEKMNLSIKDIKGHVLLISQFTLYGNCLKGNRPDFLQAAPPLIALPLYNQFVNKLKEEATIQTGQFGAKMSVSLVNDGPVTLIIESEKKQFIEKNSRNYDNDFL